MKWTNRHFVNKKFVSVIMILHVLQCPISFVPAKAHVLVPVRVRLDLDGTELEAGEKMALSHIDGAGEGEARMEGGREEEE